MRKSDKVRKSHRVSFPFHCVNHARKHHHVCLVIYHVEHIAHKASGKLAVDKWCAFVHCVAKFAVFVNSLVFARLKSECADGYNVGLLGDYREREARVAFQHLGGVVVLVERDCDNRVLACYLETCVVTHPTGLSLIHI